MIHYEGHGVQLHHGDCLDVLRTLPDASVDAVVTDPPYGLGFMGKAWDTIEAEASRPSSADEIDARFRNVFPRTGKGPSAVAFDGLAFQAWCEQWATECLRVLKPGGHLLAFGGTRTWHRLTCAVEDAGLEIRDSIAWLYGSGFPKSLDVSKAIDKAAGAEREVVGPRRWAGRMPNRVALGQMNDDAWVAKTDEEIGGTTAPATDAARKWQGWGTALKPAFEPVVVARKPLTGTVTATVLQHGTGALNIDACRIEHRTVNGGNLADNPHLREGVKRGPTTQTDYRYQRPTNGEVVATNPAGRWPANVILDEHQAATLDEMSGESVSRAGVRRNHNQGHEGWSGGTFLRTGDLHSPHDDSGGASRFMYVAKADADERPRHNGTSHPTVKPLALMRWLVRLVTPPGGTVLEPFAGSGTTVEACILEGFHCIAIEKGEEYLPLILSRITRQRDPVEAIKLAGEDLGLFGLDGLGA